MKTLRCQFQGATQHYSYLYIGSKDVQVGDWAVVHSNGSFLVIAIKGVSLGIDKPVTKPVIGIITQDDFTAYQEGVKEIEQHRRKFDELDHLMKEERRLESYRKLAETNPRAKELLDEIEGFGAQITHAVQASAEAVEAAADAQEVLEPIPEGYWYSPTSKVFYTGNWDAADNNFWNTWIDRRNEFPTNKPAVEV